MSRAMSRYNVGINAGVRQRVSGRKSCFPAPKIIHPVSLVSVNLGYDPLGFQPLSIALEEE